MFWSDSSNVFMKIFTGSCKLPISSSVYTEAKQSLSKFAASNESDHFSHTINKGPNAVFCHRFRSCICKGFWICFYILSKFFSQSTIWPFSLHCGLYCIGVCMPHIDGTLCFPVSLPHVVFFPSC